MVVLRPSRPKKVNERKEAMPLGSGLESYSESILVTSPKIVKPTAQVSVEARPTNNILFSSFEEVELVRHAEKWDAKTALLPREKARFMVRITTCHCFALTRDGTSAPPQLAGYPDGMD